MNRILKIFLILIVTNNNAISQISTNLNYGSPLEIPLIFSANFGELRSNHFHMGVDYKTKHIEGLKILAVQNGYVSRIRASSFGYGKVIYINHPEGVTSVYAHCSKFIGKIDSIISNKQKEIESYEIDIYLDSNEIIIQKGQNIALSGNTGGSTAPHLHFEIRDTKTETALNPLVFGYDIIDNKQPNLSNFKIYSISKEGYISSKTSFTYKTSLVNNVFVPEQKVINLPINFISNNGGLGFSFDVYDPYNLSSNKLGIHGSKLFINDSLIFETQIDSISFENTRYINSHTDFHEFSINRNNYHKSFKVDNNPLSIYKTNENGLKKVNVGDTLNVLYKTYDTKKNVSICRFKINIIPDNKKDYDLTDYNNRELISLKKDLMFYNLDSSIIISTDIGTFYEPTILNLEQQNNINSFSFGDKTTPIQKHINIKLILSKEDEEIKKYYLSVNNRYLNSTYSNDTLTCISKYLGEFRLKLDTISPSINAKNFTAINVNSYTKLVWKIYDSNSGLKDYDLYIDGKWYLVEYEYKDNTIIFDIPKEFNGSKNLKIIATDNCLNIKTWTKNLNF